MKNAAVPATRRAVTSVDLGELKPHVVQLSAAAGVGPSTWLRALVKRELAKEACPATNDPNSEPVSKRTGGHRAWLDADLTAKLDELRRRDGYRTRAAALRALSEGVGNSSGKGTSLRDAVDALGVSNFQLVAIGRSVNQIAKSLRAHAGKTTTADRVALERAEEAIRAHLEDAAKLVAELRPLLKKKIPV